MEPDHASTNFHPTAPDRQNERVVLDRRSKAGRLEHALRTALVAQFRTRRGREPDAAEIMLIEQSAAMLTQARQPAMKHRAEEARTLVKDAVRILAGMGLVFADTEPASPSHDDPRYAAAIEAARARDGVL
jgi:hypothetical protein